jgi:hypothetical protein
LAFCGILCDLSETASRPWWLVESFWTTNHAAMRSATKPLQSCGPRLAITALGVGESQTLTPVTRLFPVLGCRTYGFTYAIYAKKGVYTGIYGVYTLYMRSHIRLLPNPSLGCSRLRASCLYIPIRKSISHQHCPHNVRRRGCRKAGGGTPKPPPLRRDARSKPPGPPGLGTTAIIPLLGGTVRAPSPGGPKGCC